MAVPASVKLDLAWLMDPTDPTHPLVAGSTGAVGGGARTNESTQDGEFRQYVGRIRMIIRSTSVSSFQIALRMLTSDQADKLTTPVSEGGWLGKTLLLRDFYGRRVWGGYLDTQRLEYVGGKGLCDVQFTFVETTYTDEV